MDNRQRIFSACIFLQQMQVLLMCHLEMNLPASHLPYFYRHFGNQFKDDPHFQSQDFSCWGYEEDCPKSTYSWPECPNDHKGWIKTKQEQLNLFYEQGDFGYVKKHKNSIKLMCEPIFQDDSALECSEHLQFCRGRNIFVNLTSLTKRHEPFRYKMDVLKEGDIGGYCHLHKDRLMHEADHLSPLQSWAPEIRFFTPMNSRPIKEKLCDAVIEKPTFIMKIDATVNMYHHLCDFVNLYASLHVNMSHPTSFSTDVNIIIWETFVYHSAFEDMWKAFTSNPILTLQNFAGKKVCFKNVIFPLLPRMIFGLYYNTPLVYGCEKSGLFKAFSEFILHRLKVPVNARNNSLIRVTFLSRETTYRNVINERDLLSALRKIEKYQVKRIVFNREIPFLQQLEIIRNTDILIGMHGAGLTHLLFLPDWAAIFELYNCEDENCYKDLARLRGVKYVTWQDATKMERQDEGSHPNGGAHAKFTNYAFDVNEFVRLTEILAQHVITNPLFPKSIQPATHEEL